jgi:hypothetical protein
LQAGEFDKLFTGHDGYDPNRQLYKSWAKKNLTLDAKANAAKVEVTKGVLDEAIGVLDSYWVGNISKDIEEALTILKTLQEALKR